MTEPPVSNRRQTRVTILVENLPVPLDRRVWTEALALVRAEYHVSVICPQTARHPLAYEELEGVHIFRHPLPLEARGIAGFFLEYAAALLGELRLAFTVRRRFGIDIIQLCNPPDILFLVALVFRWLDGCKIVFDHHDPFPELMAIKFPRRKLLWRLARLCERLTFRSADQVITTSEALRRIAMTRGGVPADRIALVRSGIDLSRFRTGEAMRSEAVRKGAQHVVAYLGIIGSQDGVDLLLEAAHSVLRDRGRTDVRFLVIGDGPMLPALKIRAQELGIAADVEFPGYTSGEALYRLLASSDIGVCPDPKNDFNDKLSMNKIIEYMAFGLGVAMFPLEEGMLLAGPAAEVADGLEPPALADAILRLLDDPHRRQALAGIARARVEELFTWPVHEKAYLAAYARVAEGSTAA